jgi:hypothetical protein
MKINKIINFFEQVPVPVPYRKRFESIDTEFQYFKPKNFS